MNAIESMNIRRPLPVRRWNTVVTRCCGTLLCLVGAAVMKDIEAGLAANDRKKIALSAHSLKSSSGQLGAKIVQGVMTEIEAKADSASVTELAGLVKRGRSSLEDALSEIRRI